MPPTDPLIPGLELGFWTRVLIWIETIAIMIVYLIAITVVGYVYLSSGIKISLGEHELDPDKQWERE